MGTMAAQQLHLFEPARPLLQRFGAEFFRAVPPKPGVYIMGGDADRVLYIGQSGNLRHRLGSYKNARLDRAPRNVIRLVHLVRTIVWEECATAEAARLKENRLLRIHRPKFNVQNTYPQGYQFIGLRDEGGRLSICLGNELQSEGKTLWGFQKRLPSRPQRHAAACLGGIAPTDFSTRFSGAPARIRSATALFFRTRI